MESSNQNLLPQSAQSQGQNNLLADLSACVIKNAAPSKEKAKYRSFRERMFVLFDGIQENPCKFYTAISLIYLSVLVHIAGSFAISFI